MTADEIVQLTERMKALGVARFEAAGVVVVFAQTLPSFDAPEMTPLTDDQKRERTERLLYHSAPGG